MKAPCWCLMLMVILLTIKSYKTLKHSSTSTTTTSTTSTPSTPEPSLEEQHFPEKFTTAISRLVNGTELPEEIFTPDYRLEEPPWNPHDPTNSKWKYMEEERPYRISPFYKQAYQWNMIYGFFESGNKDDPFKLGCYCTTVYKKFTVLAGCAILTARHLLTTASSTEVVLQNRRNDETLYNILGAWYDVMDDSYNSSMYTTPSRIHYHPLYLRINQINITHPLPVYYDLSIWANTYRFETNMIYCSRANSGWFTYGTTTPVPGDIVIVVGFQFIKSMRKRPMPWYKYAVRTKAYQLCPKNEWGWFHCLVAKLWGKYGIESGAAWHRAGQGRNGMNDGLAAMCAFSMRLRSDEIVHYFTVLNTHRVLDWMYDAYNGWLPYEFLDSGFYDSQGMAPRVKKWELEAPYWYAQPGKQIYDEPPYYK